MPAGAARSGTPQRMQASATSGEDRSAKFSSMSAPSGTILFTRKRYAPSTETS
jgi:hypothetical protein